ncbi:MAG: L-seryl-tRNA(Sec) selenium transferase [Pseudomonadota bacterium]
MKNQLRNIPSVEKVLSLPQTAPYLRKYPRKIVVNGIRQVLHEVRSRILESGSEKSSVSTLPSLEHILKSLEAALDNASQYNLRPVINATGVVVHTNLGRSLLPAVAVRHLQAVAQSYSNLEYDLENGRRGSRYSSVVGILRELTGAEAALVVNNNAAAVLLVLDTLAKGKEVIVSRGQLVEIGGSFRIPDIMARTGAVLVEVGTTNRTHLYDYERAINSGAAFLMKVHTSNFHLVGFTSEVPLADLVILGKRYGLPVIEDLGSGSLIDLSKYGLIKEPTVQEALKAGADIVMFSGDKLLGGPQAGIILGSNELVQQIGNNPLNRALRIDKLTLAALEATLKLYLSPETVEQIPTFRMLTAPISEINRRAIRLYRSLKRVAGCEFEARLANVDSQVGGGALPLQKLPSRAVSIKPHRFSVVRIETDLRRLPRPVIGRLEEDCFIMDMRTVDDSEVPEIVRAVKAVFQTG